MTSTQPVNHAAPDRTFEQRLFVMHRGCNRPTVIADWGYSNDMLFDDELAVLFQANAIWVEHRYQGESVPASIPPAALAIAERMFGVPPAMQLMQRAAAAGKKRDAIISGIERRHLLRMPAL